MGTRTIYIDDLTGREVPESSLITHTATYNGRTFEIETTSENAHELDAIVTAYLTGERPLSAISSRGPSRSAARSNGLDKDEKQRRIDAYNQAHPDADASRYAKTVSQWWESGQKD